MMSWLMVLAQVASSAVPAQAVPPAKSQAASDGDTNTDRAIVVVGRRLKET